MSCFFELLGFSNVRSLASVIQTMVGFNAGCGFALRM
jgi:hypothetical protein